jgi:hypothetical protein
MPPLQKLAIADLHMPAPEVAEESHILAPKAAAKIALVAKRVDVAATRAENLDADKDIVGNEIHSAKNNEIYFLKGPQIKMFADEFRIGGT